MPRFYDPLTERWREMYEAKPAHVVVAEPEDMGRGGQFGAIVTDHGQGAAMNLQYTNDLARIAAMVRLRPSKDLTAAYNCERVRSYFESHLGCTVREAAYALNLSYDQAAYATRKLRAEWVGRGK